VNTLFKNKLFLLFLCSRSSANIGDSIYFITLLWTVQILTDSTTIIGIVYTAITLASLSGVLFGPLIDKYNPAVIAGFSLFGQAALIALITLLSINNNNSLIFVVIFVFIASIFSSIFYPADNTLYLKIVDVEKYKNGNSIISSTDQTVNLIGFLVGGSIIGLLGSIKTFVISGGFLILGGIIYLLMLSKNQGIKTHNKISNKQSFKESINTYTLDLKDGFRYIKTNLFLKIILPFGIISNIAMAIIIIILPSIGAKFGSSLYYSGIYVAFFIGFIVGAILSNIFKTSGLVLAISWIGNAVSLFLFSLANKWWLSFLLILLFGVFSGVLNITQNTLIQTMTPKNIIGRVMSTYTTLNNVAAPVGSLIGATLAIPFNSNVIFTLLSLALFVCGASLLLIKPFREFDLEKAILLHNHVPNSKS